RSAKTFRVEVSPETLRRTTLGRLVRGRTVNLERAARLGDRLGGHLVSGHVDGVGKLAASRREGNARVLEIDVPLSLRRYLIPKGSVALDGISLTVNSVRGKRFSVAIIPHTAKATIIGGKKAGEPFNIEVDLIGKYVEQLVQPYRKTGRGIDN
ncbi:MAG: riboflavin synthase, partial [Nitrospirae bacterium]|nr:riboflavin synthase [Nitrospirota bacterium]